MSADTQRDVFSDEKIMLAAVRLAESVVLGTTQNQVGERFVGANP